MSYLNAGSMAISGQGANEIIYAESATKLTRSSSFTFDGTTFKIATNKFYANTSGFVAINDDANAQMTVGLTINQGANDNEAFALKSSDVAHGITNEAETDTYLAIRKVDPANGGVQLEGLSAATEGVRIIGVGSSGNTSKDATANAYIKLWASQKSGTGLSQPGANQNLVVIYDGSGARWFVDVEGDTYRDGTDNTYAVYDDPMLALAFEHVMNPAMRVREAFSRWCRYNVDTLVAAGILAPKCPVTGRHYYNESALLRLVTGATWQLGIAVRQLEADLADAKARLALLEQTS